MGRTDETPRSARPARTDTRERILSASLALFNDRGPAQVTTAEIARVVGINEGNLYYHFRTKEALVLALFARFEAQAEAFAAQASEPPPGNAAVDGGLLAAWFRIVWSHRFFFRDLLMLASTMPALATPIRGLSNRMRGAVEAVLRRMAAYGLVEISDKDRAELLANVWIVATYWAVYLSLQEGVEALGDAHLAWGLNQVSSLFRPYLTQAGRAAFPRTPDAP